MYFSSLSHWPEIKHIIYFQANGEPVMQYTYYKDSFINCEVYLEKFQAMYN